MGALADVARQHRHPKGPRCAIAVIRERLTPEQLVDFEQLLSDPDMPGTALAAAIQEVAGRYLSPRMISHHRRGECLCQN